ncbi:hypothetical protein [Jannaschia aquimarina]|uniref:Uncharacterized protein n=1 Tax=Jannaschia aquimarina TaxID=935700 RepID=A0A0D1EG90_9RHOB|nr:hypothetical protein [Jannaschia aquimarina]KIT14835.1 hypothetical protein jaqu_31600 [Jannaschia aquimarina]SNS57199.1 hypothetical protein SAMN05421775_101485 [Jannaschia aquimarina]
MSDHYLFHIRFDVRHDAPAALHRALTVLSEGNAPTDAELDGLPGIVKDYLRGNTGAPGDGVHLYWHYGPKRVYRGGELVEAPREPHEGSHALRMTQTFHDDEYFNGGIYFPYWLFQFAAHDGPVATMQQTNGNELPSVVTKHGDRLIETSLAYNPDRFWPIGNERPPEQGNPVVIKENREMSLSETLEGLSVFRDGFAWE